MNELTGRPLHNSYLLVDLGILRDNVRAILADLEKNVQLIPVLKGNAYGLGMVPAARTLCTFPEIRCFAVSHVSEGLALREAGIDRNILVMGGVPPFQTEAAVCAGLTLACGRQGFLRELAQAAGKLGIRAKTELKVDVGLHRIGLEENEIDEWIAEFRACEEAVSLEGVFSHFSDAENRGRDEEEFRTFLRVLSRLEAAGIPIPFRHIAASSTSESSPQYSLDAVRCGRRLFMDRPVNPVGNIRELASWRSYITNLKERKAGERIGYGGGKQLLRDSVVATVGVGYGDGLNQDLIRVGGPVLVGGKRCRLLSCCMDQCMVDVTDADCSVGDEVTFFGYDGRGNFLSSQEVAALINGDEGCGLTSALSGRVERVYIS